MFYLQQNDGKYQIRTHIGLSDVADWICSLWRLLLLFTGLLFPKMCLEEIVYSADKFIKLLLHNNGFSCGVICTLRAAPSRGQSPPTLQTLPVPSLQRPEEPTVR